MDTMSIMMSQKYIRQKGSYENMKENNDTRIDNPVRCIITFVWGSVCLGNETLLYKEFNNYNENAYLKDSFFRNSHIACFSMFQLRLPLSLSSLTFTVCFFKRCMRFPRYNMFRFPLRVRSSHIHSI